jgi:hypothetical protein
MMMMQLLVVELMKAKEHRLKPYAATGHWTS